jgi:LmbE family N-acetylglucosaminyl deacetylase
MPEYRHVYLSPHLDDAALSCGGRIHQLARAGEGVRVVTVFAGSPKLGGDERTRSELVTALHRRWQTGVDAPAARREEDRAALRLLGAEARHLNFPDCIYRRHPVTGASLYCTEDEIFGRLHPADFSLATKVAQTLTGLVDRSGGATIYAPLATGNHVDHQVVAAAALQMLADGHRVTFYEDYPYAEERAALVTAKAWLGGDRWRMECLPLAPANLEAKIAAVLRYRSQLSTFFESDAEVDRRLRAFALAPAPHKGPCERLWHLTN